MVRLATLEDIPRLVAMGQQFRNDSVYRALIPENLPRFEWLFHRLIGGEDATVLVLERAGAIEGMLGAFIFEHPVSAERCASEMFWWVDPAARGRGIWLLKAIERWAAERGAVVMQMIAPTDEVARLYGRLSYVEVERTFQRRLAW